MSFVSSEEPALPDSDEPKRPGMIFPETPSPEEISKRFQPYVVELGTLVYIWTRLHDHLAELFWRVTGILNGNIPLAIWHSTPNDRAQRDMLRAATTAKLKAASHVLGKFEAPRPVATSFGSSIESMNWPTSEMTRSIPPIGFSLDK